MGVEGLDQADTATPTDPAESAPTPTAGTTPPTVVSLPAMASSDGEAAATAATEATTPADGAAATDAVEPTAPSLTAGSTAPAAALGTSAPVGTVRLHFRDEGETPPDDQPIAANLSAAALAGEHLWVANDETARVERLTRSADGGYGHHHAVELADLVDLPGGADGEMDIEGLAVDGGYLWIVGSHSGRRRKPEPEEHDPATVLRLLGEIRNDPNRYFLGRIPLAEGGAALAAEVEDGKGGQLRAGSLKIRKKRGNELIELLAEDDLIGPFVGLPAKENGFDVEGLAVRGERVFLGLRGPVLRGWAVILELRVEASRKGRLKLASFEDGRHYHRHLLDLGGLGVRELSWQDDDLIILAGPTMDIDGPVRVHRWRNALAATGPQVLDERTVPPVLDVPYGKGCDHAEGITVVPNGDGAALLVIYDSPAEGRIADDGRSVTADLFALPA